MPVFEKYEHCYQGRLWQDKTRLEIILLDCNMQRLADKVIKWYALRF